MNRHLLRQIALSILIIMLCTACAVQGSASIGIALSSSLLTLMLLLIGGSQSGCDIGPCLSPEPPVGPCLTLPRTGGYYGGNESVDADVGPCLSPPLAGDDLAGTEVGPCLSPPLAGDDLPPLDAAPPRDGGVTDMGQSDMGAADMSESDMGAPDFGVPVMPDAGEVGPCLSPPAPDMGRMPPPQPDPDQKRAARQQPDRAQVIERLSERGGLPADVLERIKKR